MSQPVDRASGANPAVGTLTRWYLTSYGADRIATWIAVVVLLTLAYRLTGSLAVPVAIALAQLIARSLAAMLAGRGSGPSGVLVALLGIFRVAAVAGLILVETRSDLWWAVGLIAFVAIASGFQDELLASMLPRIAGYRGITGLNRTTARTEQLSALVGPAAAAGLLLIGDQRTAFAIAALLAYLSLLMTRKLIGRVPPLQVAGPTPSYSSNPFYNSAWSPPVEVRNVVAALVVVAALAAVTRLTLLEAVLSNYAYDEWFYGLLLAVVAVGTVAGPPPMDKVLSHFPVVLVSAGAAGAVAIGAALIGFPVPVYLIVPVLVGLGLVFVTLDSAAKITFRRLIPEHRTDAANKGTQRLVQTGQGMALLALLFVSDVWGVREATLVLSLLAILIIAVNFLQSGGAKAMERVVAPGREGPAGGSGS